MGFVKGNIGHLLTGAGAAGVAKIVHMLANNSIAPTRHADEPFSQFGDSPFYLPESVQSQKPRADQQPRRAAVSAFGFGGINAHVLLADYIPNNKQETPAPESIHPAPNDDPIILVNIGARLGPWHSAAALRSHLVHNEPLPEPSYSEFNTTILHSSWVQECGLQKYLQPGYPLDNLVLDLAAHPIPPSEVAAMLPQQAAMLAATAETVNNLELGSPERRGGWFAIDLDPRATTWHVRWILRRQLTEAMATQRADIPAAEREQWINRCLVALCPPLDADHVMGSLGGIVASRCARAWTIAGQCFTLSDEENGALHAMTLGIRALKRDEIDVAIIGAVGMAGDARQLIADQRDTVSEGAVAAVAVRQSYAQQHDLPIIAEVDECAVETEFDHEYTSDSFKSRVGSCSAVDSFIPSVQPLGVFAIVFITAKMVYRKFG